MTQRIYVVHKNTSQSNQVKYVFSSLLPHDCFSLFSDLQLPVINMSGLSPGDWGNCTDFGEE